MVARRAHNPKVEGSSPSPATIYGGVAQLARAFGSYPECHWFESSRRYHKPCEACLSGFFRRAGFRGSQATPFGRAGGPPLSKGMRIARLRAAGRFARSQSIRQKQARAPGCMLKPAKRKALRVLVVRPVRFARMAFRVGV